MLYQIMFWIKYQLMSLGIGKERGQGLVEYALIVVLIAGVVVAAIVLLRTEITDLIARIGDALGEIPIEP